MSEHPAMTTDHRIFDKLAELGLEIDRSVLRFIELAQLLPLEKQAAAARKCGTLQFGNEQSEQIDLLRQSIKYGESIIRMQAVALVASEKKTARERSRAAKMMNTIKKLRAGKAG